MLDCPDRTAYYAGLRRDATRADEGAVFVIRPLEKTNQRSKIARRAGHTAAHSPDGAEQGRPTSCRFSKEDMHA
jgi:hypothetical protein